MKIPFDSLTLAAVTHELQAYVGGKVQRVVQPSEHSIGLSLYHRGTEAFLLISAEPGMPRAHLVERRPAGMKGEPGGFLQAVRARVDSGRIDFIRQVRFDRILEIGVDGPEGPHILVAELLGRHSNLILVDRKAKVISATTYLSPQRSTRPVQGGHPYAPPPGPIRPSILTAPLGADLKEYEGASPFLVKLLAASESPSPLRGGGVGEGGNHLGSKPQAPNRDSEPPESAPRPPAPLPPGERGSRRLANIVRTGTYEPFLVEGHGAYPIDPAPMGLIGWRRASISAALEQHYVREIEQQAFTREQTSLIAQLERVKLAREVALRDLAYAADAAARARETQEQAELLLAYGPSQPEVRELEVWNYQGEAQTLKIPEGKTYKEQAEALFQKAKRAKARAGEVAGQIERLSEDLDGVDATLDALRVATHLSELSPLRERAEKARWLHRQPEPNLTKEERPFQGHRVRELLGPKGYTVLYGENAEANDYLTVRLGKSNDIWLHVRGATSAHVLIQTRNQPDRVPREVIEFAARVSAQHSSAKHSSYVPVDYTLKKYVRRAKGAPKGSVLYSHEKTIHVEP